MPVWRARVCLSTSPLRRYTDWSTSGRSSRCKTARLLALVAPFKPKDAELFSIISALTRPTAPTTVLSGIERWTLKYLQQNEVSELTASFMKDNLVRADELPLVLCRHGRPGFAAQRKGPRSMAGHPTK
jgi:exoribonuclease-2